MIDYIKGKLVEKTPAYAVIEANGIGYIIHISLHTFSNIPDNELCKLLTYYAVNVDVRSGSSTHALFGFFNNEEREIFKVLIGVSGVSANTARMIFSTLSPGELVQAIEASNPEIIQRVKGIGPKLAQRIAAELKDKIKKIDAPESISYNQRNTIQSEALSALVALGFDKHKAGKVIRQIFENESNELPVEEVIKIALQKL